MVFVPEGDEEAPFPDDPFPLLNRGEFQTTELIPWGSNYTFASLIVGEDGSHCIGVYKPRRGEAPLRDFPNGTLYRREVAAFELSRLLDWDIVPPTVVREDGPHGIGSLQLYVQPRTDATARLDTLRASHLASLQRIALFDLLANNADRKGGHCLLDLRGHLWGIDHGLTFHPIPKLRTVIWDFCGEPIPDSLVRNIQEIRSDINRVQRIDERLKGLISPQELEALWQRWDRLLENPCYPPLDPYRNVPWPPF